jgi:hypothetical protein
MARVLDSSIKPAEVERRVLQAMQERFFERGAFAEFCKGFTEAVNEILLRSADYGVFRR